MKPHASKHAWWSYWRWYSMQVRHTPPNQPQWHDHQHLAWPYFAHDKNGVLTWEWLSKGGGCALYLHTASNDTTLCRGKVEINERNQGAMVAEITTKYDTFQRFDYVETKEPLKVYKCW
jgi:hypothetical protein